MSKVSSACVSLTCVPFLLSMFMAFLGVTLLFSDSPAFIALVLEGEVRPVIAALLY